MSHVYLFFSERMKKGEEDRTRWSHYPESCGPRKAWKLGFVPRRRKSEGHIFLTWMFLNLILKQRGSQRAVCLRLAKHNMTQPCRRSHSVSVPVNRATIRGGGRATARSWDGNVWHFSLLLVWLTLTSLTVYYCVSTASSSFSQGTTWI